MNAGAHEDDLSLAQIADIYESPQTSLGMPPKTIKKKTVRISTKPPIQRESDKIGESKRAKEKERQHLNCC